MSHSDFNLRPAAHHARGFSLVELMVTIAIAVFLIGGLVTIVQNVRQANLNQQSLAQLQDQQRFAMTILTDVIQAGGYYANVTGDTVGSALPPVGATMLAGQGFYGQPSNATLPAAQVTVRMQTLGGDGVIQCDGSTNHTAGVYNVYTNVFSIVNGYLYCQMTNNTTGASNSVELVQNVVGMQIWYGVNRSSPLSSYNVDTYLTADQMNSGLPNGGDWMNISAVRIMLYFVNPLNPTGIPNIGQPQYLTFERVIAVMGHAGVRT